MVSDIFHGNASFLDLSTFTRLQDASFWSLLECSASRHSNQKSCQHEKFDKNPAKWGLSEFWQKKAENGGFLRGIIFSQKLPAILDP